MGNRLLVIHCTVARPPSLYTVQSAATMSIFTTILIQNDITPERARRHVLPVASVHSGACIGTQSTTELKSGNAYGSSSIRNGRPWDMTSDNAVSSIPCDSQ